MSRSIKKALLLGFVFFHLLPCAHCAHSLSEAEGLIEQITRLIDQNIELTKQNNALINSTKTSTELIEILLANESSIAVESCKKNVYNTTLNIILQEGYKGLIKFYQDKKRDVAPNFDISLVKFFNEVAPYSWITYIPKQAESLAKNYWLLGDTTQLKEYYYKSAFWYRFLYVVTNFHNSTQEATYLEQFDTTYLEQFDTTYLEQFDTMIANALAQ